MCEVVVHKDKNALGKQLKYLLFDIYVKNNYYTTVFL